MDNAWTFPPSRRKAFLLFLGSISLAALGILMAAERPILGWLTAAFFGLGGVAWLFILLRMSRSVQPPIERQQRREVTSLADSAATIAEDDVLRQFGLIPAPDALPVIRRHLSEEINKQRCDESLMLLYCVQLFAGRDPADAMLIWAAKHATYDMSVRVDVQLLCGAGLPETKQHLVASDLQHAKVILEYITECERTGDFDGWSPDKHLALYRAEYHVASAGS
jgi:hypothetical protein